MAFLAANGHKPQGAAKAEREARKNDPRQAEELMSFFGVTPDMLVVDNDRKF